MSADSIHLTGGVIRVIERAVGSEGLKDAIDRFENPHYVQGAISRQVRGYVDLESFPSGAHILDVGCGIGASTHCLAVLFPRAKIIGIELDPAKAEAAQEIASQMGITNVSFFCSPNGNTLPVQIDGIKFQYIMLSAVWEHLLPDERRTLIPLLWSVLEPGGALLVNQTPYRWFPVETHTTGLPGLNYLPDWLAGLLARNFSRINQDLNCTRDWPGLLRGGIRGGTEWEIQKILGSSCRILQPLTGNRAEYWLNSVSSRHRGLKKILYRLFRVTDRWLGAIPSSHLEVVFRKEQ